MDRFNKSQLNSCARYLLLESRAREPSGVFTVDSGGLPTPGTNLGQQEEKQVGLGYQRY